VCLYAPAHLAGPHLDQIFSCFWAKITIKILGEKLLKIKVSQISLVTSGDKITMLGVLFSQSEVVVIIIVTAIVVFLIVRRRKR